MASHALPTHALSESGCDNGAMPEGAAVSRSINFQFIFEDRQSGSSHVHSARAGNNAQACSHPRSRLSRGLSRRLPPHPRSSFRWCFKAAITAGVWCAVCTHGISHSTLVILYSILVISFSTPVKSREWFADGRTATVHIACNASTTGGRFSLRTSSARHDVCRAVRAHRAGV